MTIKGQAPVSLMVGITHEPDLHAGARPRGHCSVHPRTDQEYRTSAEPAMHGDNVLMYILKVEHHDGRS